MAVFKCKMCGGDLEIQEGLTICECEFCGTKQTIPALDNEKKLNLFNRANRLRLNSEFDKAASIYENIIAEFPEEAEGYWGLVLCNYGIEYVDDPATAKKIPTCHRAAFESVTKDENYELALEYADVVSQKIYRDEAREIDRIMSEILSISKNEQPYDIFICYKETDDAGGRTIDSVIAQDVYDALTDKGYRVFFSRISLEDKLGKQYEPYIFAALNSAKVMLAFGTKYEYFHAVWVKNEWSRFLKLMAKDKSKSLVPCYKDIDPYDMPDEFKVLQAQDMGKVGAIQDLLRGIDKLMPKKEIVKETVVVNQVNNGVNATIDTLIKRAFMFLEDKDFNSANEYCEKVLDVDPENADAYLGKLLAELKVSDKEKLKDTEEPFDNSLNYQKVVRYGNEEQKKFVVGCSEYVVNNEKIRLEGIYNNAKALASQNTIQSTQRASELFRSIINYKDSSSLADECIKKIEMLQQEAIDKIAKLSRMVSAGSYHTVGLKSDGTVVTVGSGYYGRCNVDSWTDIESISAGDNHTVGLKSDGTVVAVGDNDDGQCNVSSWTDIVTISAGGGHTVGLKSDGTVVAVGWNEFGQCDVDSWTDIVAISAGSGHTVGLKSDGTVVAVGDNGSGQCDVDSWTDIVAISAGDNHTVGLKSDGTVVAVGSNSSGQCDVDSWTDIVAISAGSGHTVGLKSDGTVVAVGRNGDGQCNGQRWKLCDNSNNLEEERKIKMAVTTQRRSSCLCQYCGGQFKGLLTKKCINCGREKNY